MVVIIAKAFFYLIESKCLLGSLPKLRGALRRRAAGKLGIALVPFMLVKKG